MAYHNDTLVVYSLVKPINETDACKDRMGYCYKLDWSEGQVTPETGFRLDHQSVDLTEFPEDFNAESVINNAKEGERLP